MVAQLVTEPQVTMLKPRWDWAQEEAQQWYDEGDTVGKCQVNDETARVHRVQCRVVCLWRLGTFTMLKPWRGRPYLYNIEAQSNQSLLSVDEAAFIMSGCHSPFEIKQETSFIRVIALQRFGPSSHVGSGTRSLDSLMEELSARLNALEQGVRQRDAHIQHLNNMLTQQQTALQAQSSGTSVTQPDLHREMLARVKEFDGYDDKLPGWWFKLQSFLKANHIGYEALIERIAQETDATKQTNSVLSNADKKLSSSLYYVLGLTMTDESKSPQKKYATRQSMKVQLLYTSWRSISLTTSLSKKNSKKHMFLLFFLFSCVFMFSFLFFFVPLFSFFLIFLFTSASA